MDQFALLRFILFEVQILMTTIRFTITTICLCLLALAFSACATKEDETMKAIREEAERRNAPITDLVSVSFQQSDDVTAERLPPYSHSFRAVRAGWSAGASYDNEQFLYTTHIYCLEGPVYVSRDGQQQTIPDTVKLCFQVNDPAPYSLIAQPLHTGTFPIGQLIPGKMYSNEVDKVVSVRLEVKEYTKESNYPNNRTLSLLNQEAEGTLEITESTKERIAGKIDIKDSNLAIAGNFNCLVSSFFMK